MQTFPAVTICNLNPFDTSNSQTSSFISTILKKNGMTSTISPQTGEYAIYMVRETMDVIKSSALANVKGNSSFVRSLGYDLNTLLLSCFFNGFTCNSSDFFWYYSYEYGNCYIFNHNYGDGTALKVVSESGPNSGLQLELFTGYPGKGNSYMEQSGFYLSVNNNSQLPLTKYEGIFIPTGYASKIAMDKTYYYKLDSPYSDCRMDTSTYTDSDSVYYKKTLNVTKYSQKLCFEICMQNEYIIPVCECADPSIPITDSSQTVCSSLNEIKCANNVTSQFNSVDLSITCAEYCPLECDSQDFEYSISLSNYPTTPYYKIISQQSNFNTKFTSGSSGPSQTIFKESCALVNVFLSDMYYTEIVESADLTLEGVFGTIGMIG